MLQVLQYLTQLRIFFSDDSIQNNLHEDSEQSHWKYGYTVQSSNTTNRSCVYTKYNARVEMGVATVSFSIYRVLLDV